MATFFYFVLDKKNIYRQLMQLLTVNQRIV